MTDAGAERVWVASMASAYATHLAPVVFAPFAAELAARAARRAPGSVLEIAAGTGVLTRELLAAGARVIATDLNPAMVEVGRASAPEAEWREADAMELPFEPATFDLVVCQFGAMFFPDKPAAFAEVRRVLVPDGALIMNVWAPLETHAFESALVDALHELYPADPPTFIAAVPHGYADARKLVDDLAAGGLTAGAVETIAVEGHAPSATDLAVGYATGTPLRAELVTRGDLDAATQRIAAAMTARLGEGPVTGTMSAMVVEATPTG